MMPNHELRGGRLAETEIQVAPATQEEKVLSRLNQGFRISKAQQILRLLKDQDELNKRFRECALLDDEDNEGEVAMGRQQEGDPDTWSLEEEQQSEADSDESQHEAERRAARLVSLRKHRNSIDPGRCKTSMGFYNQAELTEIPYDTDSDNMAGLDSAASTPRGGPYPVLSARQPTQQSYGVGGQNPNGRGGNARMRVYHLKMAENDVDVVALPEECVVQSARSVRPKTSLNQTSARSRYYRQQPHPEAKHHQHSHTHHHHHQQHHQHHHHLNNNHNSYTQQFYQQQQQQQQRGVGETRQAIISRLDPHHPMAVRPFCDNMVPAHEEVTLGMSPHTSQPSTPRGTPRSSGNGQYLQHTEVTLFDMAPTKEPTPRSKRAGGAGSSMGRSPSFAEYGSKGGPIVVPANRPMISVDSSPLQHANHEDGGSARRPKSTRVKKRVGEMPRGTVSTSMHVISDRAHPLAVMKLPPLETAVNKTGSGRDLVCVGKD